MLTDTVAASWPAKALRDAIGFKEAPAAAAKPRTPSEAEPFAQQVLRDPPVGLRERLMRMRRHRGEQPAGKAPARRPSRRRDCADERLQIRAAPLSPLRPIRFRQLIAHPPVHEPLVAPPVRLGRLDPRGTGLPQEIGGPLNAPA